MKISAAIRRAWEAYTASIGETMNFLVTEACLTLICFVPLLALSRVELAPMAWLCPVLWVFLLLPARMNAALGMREGLAGGKLGTARLIEMSGYGKKLLQGLKRVFFLLLWSAPLIALGIAFRIHFSGDVDSFTVLRMVKNDLGGGDQMRGILVVLLMLVCALLLVMIGCAFHSGTRHAYAQGNPSLVRGHHGKVICCWLASLLAVLPLLIAILAIVLRYLPALSDLNGLLMKTVSLPSTKGTALSLGLGVVLTIPLLPLRSLIPAALVAEMAKES